MAGVSAPEAVAILDWSLRGVGSAPSAWYVGVSLGVPSSTSGSELGTGSGMTRQTVTFGAAASPAGTASNVNAMTFGPSSGGTFSGMQVWNTGAATAGVMLYYGAFATPRTLGAGDSLVISAAQLVIQLV
jgi:hypothetical protein